MRSDIYSLGETLWFALTGKTPFAGHSVEEIHRAQKSNVLPIEQLKAAHVPLSPEIAARIDARTGTGVAARHPRVSSAPATLFPGGTQRATHACRSRSRSPRRSRHVCTFRLSTTADPKFAFESAAPDKSIAVLPFENRSEDKANAYFADGIQDEILTRLSKIADLKVISRTSTQQYQSKPANLREIAKQLGVAHILEGSVQKVADQVRVNVQLINAQTDSHLWADTFDRKLTDIFSVESEVAKAIAESIASEAHRSAKSKSYRR